MKFASIPLALCGLFVFTSAAFTQTAADPKTYPDEAGFKQRGKLVIDELATKDFAAWETGGYFGNGGGDPAKYAVPVMIAKLMVDPKDPTPWEYLGRGRHTKETYHFAIVNMTRLFYLYGKTMPENLREAYLASIAKDGGILGKPSNLHLGGGGTENHMTMWRTSGYAFASMFPDRRIGNQTSEEARNITSELLRRYVKNLYTVGNGEWDSSTYIQFTIDGFLNIYDTAQDEQMKTLARAALDWFCATYGQKYFRGCLSGAEARGFASVPVASDTDSGMWLWFDHSIDKPTNWQGTRFVTHEITSTYRPNQVLYNIATKKDLKMPFEIRGSKPNYPMTTNNESQEYVWMSTNYSIGGVYTDRLGTNPGDNQCTTWKLLSRAPDITLVLGGCQPWHNSGPEGRSPFDQLHFGKGAVISMTYVPEGANPGGDNEKKQGGKTPEDKAAESRFFIPRGVKETVEHDGWIFIDAHGAYVAVHPLSATYKLEDAVPDQKGKPSEWTKIVVMPGERTGFIVDTADSMSGTFLDFQKNITTKAKIDNSRFQKELALSYTSLAGEKLEMTYNQKGLKANASIDGKSVTYTGWPVTESPWINEKLNSGVMTISDGKDGYMIDYSGDWPIYKSRAK